MSAQKRKDTPLLAVAAELSAGKDKSRAAHCCGAPPASNVSYYVRPSVCNVGLSTAEGIAKPESDWNAANAPRV